MRIKKPAWTSLWNVRIARIVQDERSRVVTRLLRANEHRPAAERRWSLHVGVAEVALVVEDKKNLAAAGGDRRPPPLFDGLSERRSAAADVIGRNAPGRGKDGS